MLEEPPLTDEQVYDLLHKALLLLSHQNVATPLGKDVLTLGIKQLELLQQAMVSLETTK